MNDRSAPARERFCLEIVVATLVLFSGWGKCLSGMACSEEELGGHDGDTDLGRAPERSRASSSDRYRKRLRSNNLPSPWLLTARLAGTCGIRPAASQRPACSRFE